MQNILSCATDFTQYVIPLQQTNNSNSFKVRIVWVTLLLFLLRHRLCWRLLTFEKRCSVLTPGKRAVCIYNINTLLNTRPTCSRRLWIRPDTDTRPGRDICHESGPCSCLPEDAVQKQHSDIIAVQPWSSSPSPSPSCRQYCYFSHQNRCD